jgi:amidase
MTTTYWEITVRAKRAGVEELIPKNWKLKLSDIPPAKSLRDVTEYIRRFMTPRELEITESNASDILVKIRFGAWKSLEVTRAFCHRAALAHQFVNCLSEICFVEAEAHAQELDDYLQWHGETIGPLHGLPISLKDRFHVRGLDTACGYVSWLGSKKTVEDEGVLVQRLRQLGAVIFVKTNVPMSMLVCFPRDFLSVRR